MHTKTDTLERSTRATPAQVSTITFTLHSYARLTVRRVGQQVSESYRKLRNTLRYLSGSLFDFDPKKDSVPYEDLPSLDK